MKNVTSAFTVINRNYGHWDIVVGGGRAFRIRGGPGDFAAMDERKAPYPVTRGFKSLSSCMAFICDELMFELVKPDNLTGNNIPIEP